jgi:predicted transcriptional regulator
LNSYLYSFSNGKVCIAFKNLLERNILFGIIIMNKYLNGNGFVNFMRPELDEIKHIRKRLNITQSGLAKISNVSQSLIAKIEAGRIDPTYTNVRKIWDAIESLSNKKEKKAKDIMQKGIISIPPDKNIKDGIKQMRKYGISQIPVINDNKSIGLISESIILNALIEGRTNLAVKDIMEDPAPVVS